MTNKYLEITPKTIVGEVLNTYPELEDKLIEIAPVFKKLKKPVLRRTIAKVTTLKQASVVANISIALLINELRKTVNQDMIKVEDENKVNSEKPSWVIKENIKNEYDASIDLENGLHPAAKVTKEILQLNGTDIYLLTTPFIPAPLIKIIEEKGYKTFTEQKSPNTFHTFICK